MIWETADYSVIKKANKKYKGISGIAIETIFNQEYAFLGTTTLTIYSLFSVLSIMNVYSSSKQSIMISVLLHSIGFIIGIIFIVKIHIVSSVDINSIKYSDKCMKEYANIAIKNDIYHGIASF